MIIIMLISNIKSWGNTFLSVLEDKGVLNFYFAWIKLKN